MVDNGLVRKVDDVGRLVIPYDFYKKFGIYRGDEVEIFTSDEGIIIKKHKKDDIKSDINSLIRKYETDGKNFDIIKMLEKIVKE